jgi:hypothetical protein
MNNDQAGKGGEAAFTPGPWIVATSCSWRRIINARGDGVCVPTIQHSDNHPDLHFPNGGESGPDARLIAAAPELYEALSAALLVLGGQDMTKQSLISALESGTAALAKARGEK